jgi:hypothetical protein
MPHRSSNFLLCTLYRLLGQASEYETSKSCMSVAAIPEKTIGCSSLIICLRMLTFLFEGISIVNILSSPERRQLKAIVDVMEVG